MLEAALLKFDRIGAGAQGCVNELDSHFEDAIVVDANLGDDISGVAIANQAVANF